MNKRIKVITIMLLTVIITAFCLNNSYAIDDIIVVNENKSEAFENWENLSDEDRQNTIQPPMFNINIDDSLKKSTFQNIVNGKLGNSVQSTYKRTGLKVKNQQATKLCWAFAFSSMLEGSGSGKEYSPAYLDYKVSSQFNKKIGDGGNYYLALGTSTNGSYPVLESEFPFLDYYNPSLYSSSTCYLKPISEIDSNVLRKQANARIKDATYFGNIFKYIDEQGTLRYYDGQNSDDNGNLVYYTEEQVNVMRNQIKEHLQNNGPISTMMYSKINLTATGTFSNTEYFNAETGAYCCNQIPKTLTGQELGVNHGITIVGWDDTYEVSNFIAETAPKNPGAYIALNSYGESLGDEGYIYISYEDVFIEQLMVGIDDFEEYDNNSNNTKLKNYQHDEMGFNYGLPINTESGSIFLANVFDRENSSESEYLKEVGLFLPITEGVQIYVNGANGTPTNLEQVAVETDQITPGYHVIKLSNPIELTGNKFVVAVKLTNKESKPQIPLEMNFKDSGLVNIDCFYDTIRANEGESLISLNGTSWTDINNVSLGNNRKITNSNVCIKAFTQSVPKPATVSTFSVALDKEELVLQKGEKGNLVATVYPANATNKNVTWSSNDTSVATVSNEGIITAVGKGTASITVKTVDGEHTASCRVIVTEKSQDPDDIYQDDDGGTIVNETDIPGQEIDPTVSPEILPDTGKTILIIFICSLGLITLVLAGIKIKGLKDIK